MSPSPKPPAPNPQVEIRWWHATPAATKAPIVLLHEGLGSVSAWRTFPDELAGRTGRDVLAYSRRGYGRSAPRGRGLPVTFMHDEARDHLPRVLDAAGVKRAVLFGHSDGGSIALLAAAEYPSRVEALVVEAPHVFVEDVTVQSIARIGEAFVQSDLRSRLARHHDHPDEAFRGWHDVWLDPAFRAWSIENGLPGIQCPVLLIQGTDDEYGTLAQLDAIRQGVPGDVEQLVIQNCGHSPHRDQPTAVLDATTTFLEQFGPTRP